MKNKLKAIFLCMLYVSGYQTLSAGTIPGDYSNKRIVISGIINNLKNPRYREKPISPIVVGFAPRAVSTGINQPPLVYDNFFCALITWGYKAQRYDYLRTAPPNDRETVRAYVAAFHHDMHSSGICTTNARTIFTVTPTAIIYDDDGPVRNMRQKSKPLTLN